jgi:hypothetical protein
MNRRHPHHRCTTLAALTVASMAVALFVMPSACSGPTNAGAAAATEAGARTETPATSPLDPRAITAITGGSPEVSGNAVKVSFPRTDVPMQIDGWSDVPPFMGLTSYAAFMPIDGGKVIVMGDLVLFEDEVNPVMSAALDKGLDVTALHNHFFFAKPPVYFMHIGARAPSTWSLREFVRRWTA